MKKIFAYGTLLDPNIQMEVLGRVLDGTTSSVAGYRVLSNYVVNGVWYPIAVKDVNSIVAGKWFEVADDEFIKLDEYETNDYIRAVLKTTDGIEVHMYVKPLSYEQWYTEYRCSHKLPQ